MPFVASTGERVAKSRPTMRSCGGMGAGLEAKVRNDAAARAHVSIAAR
jgi:hypothetical protein